MCFVGFVRCSQGVYWNDETREHLRNAYNREALDAEGFDASTAAHENNVLRTIAFNKKREQVIAAVREAKARSVREVDAISEATNAVRLFAEKSMSYGYKIFFDQMGLPCYNEENNGDDMEQAQTDLDQKLDRIHTLHAANVKARCDAVLERRFGKDVKFLGDDQSCTLRVWSHKTKKWCTLTRFPKVELHVWRHRLNDDDVIEEINRLRCAN
jgi:hypothetical protein